MKKICLLLSFYLNTAVSQTPCSKDKLPIVFVHGFLASGDTWASQVQRFSSNGYCEALLFTFDWNTLGGKKQDSLLDRFIDEVLSKTKAKQLNLVGHSAGGGLCYQYLKDSSRSSKIARYAHIGSGKIKANAGFKSNIPTLNIFSTGDMVLNNGGSENVNNHAETGNDHLQVATSAETFTALYSFFNAGEKPLAEKIIETNSPKLTVSGKVVTLGENKAVKDATVFVYAFDAITGQRKPDQPIATITSAIDGSWNNISIPKNTYTEFEVHPENAAVISYYFEPFKRDNLHIYLRTIPAAGMAALILNKLPNDEKQSALAIFTINNAVIAGRDTLSIDSFTLSSSLLANANKTIIASFIFDDGDGISSGKPMKQFGTGVFINGVDILLPADKNKSVTLMYNQRKMILPSVSSREKIMVAVFN